MNDWDKILDDFARKCKGGAPDMTNSRHLALLRESLIKFGWKENATNEFIGNLRNGKEVIVEKRKPGETWKTKSGWAGLKAGGISGEELYAQRTAIFFPLLLAAVGILVSVIGTFFVKVKEGGNRCHGLKDNRSHSIDSS